MMSNIGDFTTPCDNCVLKLEHDGIAKRMDNRLIELEKEAQNWKNKCIAINMKYLTLFDENHDLRKRVKELENACDEEAETSAKTNDARLAAEKEAENWKREYYNLLRIDRNIDPNGYYIHLDMTLDRLKDDDETVSKLQDILDRIKKQKTPGITTTPVFDTEFFAPGKMFRVDRYVRKGDDRNFAESCNVVIICASSQNTRLECRSIDKDNACVTIDISRFINGEIVLTPIKIVEGE